jgi:predicted AAA+ superfamily ATPase
LFLFIQELLKITHFVFCIKNNFFKGKAIILLGPRQVGKTTLIQELLEEKEHLFLNGDDPAIRAMLENVST